MSVIEDAIYTQLSGYAGLTALVGVRIYPTGNVDSKVAKPYVAYERISTVRMSNMGSDSGLVNARFQFTAWATTSQNDASSIVTQLRGALQRWRGTVSSVVIQDTFIENELVRYDPETKLKGASLDALIWYRE